ncbi:MAG: TraB domain-containing protein [Candidatus Margulisiibacteriota bacterium]
MENIIIVSTSHVAKESVVRVRKTILEEKPEIVAVELDQNRFMGLFQKQRSIPLSAIFKIGIASYIFFTIARVLQQKIGRMVGVSPGAEMKAAVLAARDSGAKIALIDRRIEVTVQRLTKAITWREKFRFAADFFNGLLGRGEVMELNKFDLAKVPPSELIKRVMNYMKKRYPTIYRVLVAERDEIMAKNLAEISRIEGGKKIVAVVGAGHEEGLKSRLSEEFKKLKK